MKKILSLIFVLTVLASVLASFGTVSAAGGEIFVSPDGSDSADGSRENPVATLNRACELAESGTVITLLGGTLPGLFSGAMVTETLFQIPGIGYTSYQAVLQGDIPFVMFYMLFSAVLILLGNLIADILYAVVDPRVRVN